MCSVFCFCSAAIQKEAMQPGEGHGYVFLGNPSSSLNSSTAFVGYLSKG